MSDGPLSKLSQSLFQEIEEKTKLLSIITCDIEVQI